MNTLKKTLFLSNKKNNIAILTMEKKNSNIFCTLKSYNDVPNGDLILGIECNNSIIKQNINFSNNPLNFILQNNIDLSENLSCIILKKNINDYETVMFGSNLSTNYISKIIEHLQLNYIKTNKLSEKNDNKIKTNEEIQIENSIELESNKKNLKEYNNFENTEFIQKNDNSDNISNNEEIAVAQSELFENSPNEIDDLIDKELKNSNHKFYNMIKDQLDELFEKYPKEHNLEELIEDSKWVKINYEDNDKFYVVGLIYDKLDIKYICYGVPGNYNKEPPKELKGYSQWLPTDIKNPYENGYWVMYQDSETGENILIN